MNKPTKGTSGLLYPNVSLLNYPTSHHLGQFTHQPPSFIFSTSQLHIISIHVIVYVKSSQFKPSFPSIVQCLSVQYHLDPDRLCVCVMFFVGHFRYFCVFEYTYTLSLFLIVDYKFAESAYRMYPRAYSAWHYHCISAVPVGGLAPGHLDHCNGDESGRC